MFDLGGLEAWGFGEGSANKLWRKQVLSFLLIWGFKVFVLGASQYARLCYILVPDNTDCLGFLGFSGFFQPNPQTRNPYPKNIPTTGKEGSCLADRVLSEVT